MYVAYLFNYKTGEIKKVGTPQAEFKLIAFADWERIDEEQFNKYKLAYDFAIHALANEYQED